MNGRALLPLTLALTSLFAAGCSTEGDMPASATRSLSAPANSIFVSKGDTLYRLAQQYNVPLRDLIDANGLTPPYVLVPGQRLTLPVPRTYVVKNGDTLYGLSRQFQVDMAELVRLNNIQAPFTVQTGQTLRLPGQSLVPTTTVAAAPLASGAGAPRPPARKPEPPVAASSAPVARSAQRPTIEATPLPPPAAQPSAPVAQPTSPSRPAAPASAPATVNGRKGVEAETLAPPPAAPVSSAPATREPPADHQPASVAPAPQQPAPVPEPQVAAATKPPPAPAAIDDTPPPRTASRFLWPVRGTILSGFGDKPGGLRNDGINIGAAKGAAVAAADAGIVAYAGNQLKSFGNLVLIRHDGGWVTVYAHLDSIAVTQGQRVTRGQGIGTVGQTGNVRSPQLHFAVRKGEQVLNPMDQLEK